MLLLGLAHQMLTVQVCMDDATNCVVVRRMIERESGPWSFFTRRTCHCLGFLFEDIEKCAWVHNVLKSATKITVFITQKQSSLAMFHKFPTRFA